MNGGADISAVISKLTEDPERLRGVISAVSEAVGASSNANGTENGSSPSPQPDAEMLARLAPIASLLAPREGRDAGSSPSKGNPRCELLRALKPFLSPSRCEAVDYIIKLDGLGGLLNGFKG